MNLSVPQVGQTIQSRYRIEAFVREGGMAGIYCCSLLDGGQQVALKILHPHFAGKSRFVKRFLREAEVISRLDHRNIVRILDVGEDGGQLYIAMELLVGEELAEAARRGEVDQRRAVEILIDVCGALGHAHDKGVIHRDVKPDNVFLAQGASDSGMVTKVLDFGIAKLLDDETDASPRSIADQGHRSYLTRVGTLVGTPAYMSPEQGRAEPVDRRHDIYSCGVVLFELLTGRRPFEGETPMQIVMRHVNETCPKPSDFAPVAPELERIILRALSKFPAERQQTAGELAAELAQVLPTLTGDGGKVARPRASGPNGTSRGLAVPAASSRPLRQSREGQRPRIPVPPPSNAGSSSSRDPTGETVVVPVEQLAAAELMERTGETVVKRILPDGTEDDSGPDSVVTSIVSSPGHEDSIDGAMIAPALDDGVLSLEGDGRSVGASPGEPAQPPPKRPLQSANGFLFTTAVMDLPLAGTTPGPLETGARAGAPEAATPMLGVPRIRSESDPTAEDERTALMSMPAGVPTVPAAPIASVSPRGVIGPPADSGRGAPPPGGYPAPWYPNDGIQGAPRESQMLRRLVVALGTLLALSLVLLGYSVYALLHRGR